MRSVEIRAPGDIVQDFLHDPYLVLRLNPSWHVREAATDDRNTYAITIHDDRTDDISRINLRVESSEGSVSYRIGQESIVFTVSESAPRTTQLSVSGGFFREEDLGYWLKGLKNYIQLATGQRSLMKWFLDRVWLRMTPSQRRIAFIVIIAEGIGFAALIAVIITLKILRFMS